MDSSWLKQSDNISESLEMAIANRTEEIYDMLAKLETGKKRDLAKLHDSKEMCSKQILGFLCVFQIYLTD